MSAEDQVSNGSRHPKAGTKVPWGLGNVHAINAYLWKSTTAHGGQLYESIAVDPCPSMVLFFVLVFSGEDHLRVLFHWLLLLPSLTQSLGSYISTSRQLDETMPSPQGGGGTSLTAWSFSFI